MNHGKRLSIINDFLGSAHVFSLAVNELMAQKIRETITSELTLSQLKLLKLISKTNAEKISDVAGFLGVSHPAASKAVDRLVRRGLVDRREDTEDRRAAHLSLTRSGQRLLDRYIEAENRTMEGLFRQVLPDELTSTAEMLDRLSADLIDHSEGLEKMCFRCGIYFRDKCLVRDVVSGSCFYARARRKKKEKAGSS